MLPFLSILPARFGERLPRPNFIRLHWTYFILTTLFFSLIFWASSKPHEHVAYIDSLFLVIAAMTQAGMNTVNLSSLNSFQQCILALLIICGNQITVSAVVVWVRKRAFEKRFNQADELARQQAERALFSGGAGADYPDYLRSKPQTLHLGSNSSHSYQLPSTKSRFAATVKSVSETTNEKISPSTDSATLRDSETSNTPLNAPGARNRWFNTRNNEPLLHAADRNGQFRGLSPEEKERVRCIEYRAVRFLAYVVPAYSIIFQSFGCLSLGGYMAYNRADVALANAQNPWWVGIFFGITAFSNTGMSLLDLSTTPFATSIYPLIIFSILMWAGNTAYPVLLRLILWTSLRVIPKSPAYQEVRSTIEFILKYPRRVYTNLFPAAQTWWLLMVLVLFSAVDWTAFELLNRFNPVVTSLPMGYRIVDGLFQSFAVRSSGFCVIWISSLAIGLQALYVMMMYISAFPVVMAMRNSNVYEERSLGIYAEDITAATSDTDSILAARKTRFYFLREQVQRQLGHDLWFITVCMVIVVIIETAQIVADPINYSVFNIIFEVVSAYGCVGLSIGYPGVAYAFSGEWHHLSKFVLCVMMLRGRHRGLPVEIDRAIQLPGEGPEEREEGSRGDEVNYRV